MKSEPTLMFGNNPHLIIYTHFLDPQRMYSIYYLDLENNTSLVGLAFSTVSLAKSPKSTNIVFT